METTYLREEEDLFGKSGLIGSYFKNPLFIKHILIYLRSRK
jgi:hypothetical protein